MLRVRVSFQIRAVKRKRRKGLKFTIEIEIDPIPPGLT